MQTSPQHTTIAYRCVDKIALLTHGCCPVNENEWQGCMETMQNDVIAKKAKHLIVWSLGGAPRHNQRAQLVALLGFHQIGTTVIICDQHAYLDASGAHVTAQNWSYTATPITWIPSEWQQAIEHTPCSSQQTAYDALQDMLHNVVPLH